MKLIACQGIRMPDKKSISKTLLIMKMLTVIMLAFSLSSSADGYSQKLSLSEKNAPLEKVFKEIKKQTGYKFVYTQRILKKIDKVSISIENATIDQILSEIFKNQSLTYTIRNGYIILKDEGESVQDEKVYYSPPPPPPSIAITGKVTNNSNAPLAGATIKEKGVDNATSSKDDGSFSISVASKNSVLQVSYVGYENQEITVGNQTFIPITLFLANAQLNDIVVVGYGTQKKSDVISSVVTVKPESLTKVPSSDVGEMLRGKATGVLVSTADASPGSSSNILIRGKRSINGGNSPLVIADGVQISDINQVNPNDIASMEILKDAAAQAIYGARASNGVILITTKRGKIGKPQVNYTGYYGLQTIQKHFETYSGEEFVAYKREAFRANGGNNGAFLPDNQVFTASELRTIASGEYIDWEDKVLHLAPISSHNVGIAAGTDKTKVFSSFNYFGQQGVVKGTNFDRGIIRLNVDQVLTNWLKLGVNSSWQISEKDNPGISQITNSPQASMLVRTITTSPLGQVYNDDGTLKLHPSGVQDSYNPLLDLQEITNNTKENRSIMNVFLDVDPFKGLHYRLNVSRTAANQKLYNFNSSISLPGILAGGYGTGSVNYGDMVDKQLENIINYKPEFKNTQHDLGITLVQSILNRQASLFTNSSSKIPSDEIGIYYLAAGANQPTITATERNLLSYVGRAQYSYAGKYYLSGSMRADGSSVFGANNKWGYFPAGAIGWNINKENFLINSKVINQLKLRLSYGSVGNEGIAPYQSLNTVNPYNYFFGGIANSGLLPGSRIPNPSLRWETTTTFNGAIDFGFFSGNRISGTVEVYNSETKDLLVNRAIVQVTGYGSSQTNVGQVRNRGIEFSLNADIIKKRDFKLSAGFMANANRNKIISLYGEDKNGDGKEDDDVANRWFIGQPIDVYYDYKMVGIFSTQKQIDASNTPAAKLGEIQVWDRDPNDGVLNPNDRVITSAQPDWYGTFNLNIDYKGFDFTTNLYTVQGVTKFNTFLVDYWTGGNPRGILSGVKQDYWTPEHPTGTRPRPLESSGRRFMDQGNVTAGLQDASFFRLQTISLGYTLPNSTLSKLKLNNLRFYITGQNLLTITEFESYDPENDARSYPAAVMVTGGIQLGF